MNRKIESLRTPAGPMLMLKSVGIIAFLVGIGPIQGFSQPIGTIKFSPTDPKPKTTLKLVVELFPSSRQKSAVSIRLFTWRDLNNDCRYSASGEEAQNTIVVADNDPENDEDPLENEILVPVYVVPQDHPPLKYAVAVSYENTSKLHAINVPLPTSYACDLTDTGSEWDLRKLFSFPQDIARALRKLRLSLRGPDDEPYEGEHSVYLYSLETETLERVVYDATARFTSPVLSPKGDKIALIVKEGEQRSLAWKNMADPQLSFFSTTGDDRTPFWLADNSQIVFVRDRRLYLANVRDNHVQSMLDGVAVDNILGISETQEGSISIIYEVLEDKTSYVLIMDETFNLVDSFPLINSPLWFLLSARSSSANQVVYPKRLDARDEKVNGLAIRSLTTDVETFLFGDSYRYNHPSWSRDEAEIVFVSSRGE